MRQLASIVAAEQAKAVAAVAEADVGLPTRASRLPLAGAKVLRPLTVSTVRGGPKIDSKLNKRNIFVSAHKVLS